MGFFPDQAVGSAENTATHLVKSGLQVIKSQIARPNNLADIIGQERFFYVDIPAFLREKTANLPALRSAMKEIIWKTDITPGEEYARDAFLQNVPQVHIKNSPVVDMKTDYFGKMISIHGLSQEKQYTVTDIGNGVLAVKEQADGIVGYVTADPFVGSPSDDVLETDLQPIENLAHEQISFKGPDADINSLRAFLTDGTEAASELYPELNPMLLPPEEQYYVWKAAGDPSTRASARIISQTIDYEGGDYRNHFSARVFSALKGDRDLLNGLADTIKRIRTQPDTQLGMGTIQAISVAINITQTRLIDCAYLLTPVSERNSSKEIHARYEYLLPKLKELLQETVKSVNETQTNEDIATAADYHLSAFSAYLETVNSLAEYFSGKPLIPQPLDPQELTRIQDGYTRYQSPAAYNMLLNNFFLKTMINQNDIPLATRDRWLQDFMQHVIELGVYGEKASAYTNSKLDRERFVPLIEDLFDGVRMGEIQHKLPAHWKGVSIASGNMKRIEEEVFAEIQKSRPDAMPSEVLGIDMFAQPDRWTDKNEADKDMVTFIKSPIETVLRDHPDLKEKFDIAWAFGSPWNNQDLERMHILYFLSAANLVKDGGFLIYDMGSDLPTQTLNTRKKRSDSFHELFPTKPVGDMPINPQYKRPTDSLDETGAHIYSHQEIVWLADLAGFTVISPPPDPAEFQQLIDSIQDPEAFRKTTLEQKNALKMPFYMQDAESYTSGETVNARADYIFIKTHAPKIETDYFTRPFYATALTEVEGLLHSTALPASVAG